MKEILDNKVTCNIVELCFELAEKRLIQYYEQFYPSKSKDEIEKMIYIEDENGTSYTEHTQDLFNQLYDEYYTLIESLAL